MSLPAHVGWFLAFLFKEFIADFAKRLAENLADRAARMRHYIRRKRNAK